MIIALFIAIAVSTFAIVSMLALASVDSGYVDRYNDIDEGNQ